MAAGGWAAAARGAGAEAQREEAPPAAPKPALSISVPKSSSAQGLTTLVVDANAFIEGIGVSGMQYELCTIREVVSEIRDPRARANFQALPVPLKYSEPSPESLSAVKEFARATGDLQVLSATDLKVIALAHTLEVQIHGGGHLRTRPPPLIRTPAGERERDPPGWGSNVQNAEEWDELPEEDDEASGTSSRILEVKELLESSGEKAAEVTKEAEEHKEEQVTRNALNRSEKAARRRAEKARALMKSKLMVAEGVDASKGDYGDNQEAEWQRAGSRSTRRKHMKKAARADSSIATEDVPNHGELDTDLGSVSKDQELSDEEVDVCAESDDAEEQQEAEELSQEEARLQSLKLQPGAVKETGPGWMSTVACMTSDFSMQNVILQMGLRLFTLNGVQVRQLQRWMLKCHACGNLTREVGRIFCPKCGNGGTLFRVSVLTGSDGIVQSGSLRRVNVRGTRYSLPQPKGGREGAALNPVLREDQLPRKLLRPKSNKSKSAQGLDLITSFDDVFSNKDKGTHESAALKNTVAVLSGRKNPNDQHWNKRRV